MPAPRFVHLRLHSEYSIVDGIARVDAAVDAAADDGMPALAITDLSNLFGAVKFFQAARGVGVQPLIGCDLWLTNERSRDHPYRFVVLCRDRTGYLALCELVTRAHEQNQWRGRAEIRREWLKGLSGLIVLSGARHGDVGQALMAGNPAQAEALAREWDADFPGAYYVEVQRADPDRDEPHLRAAVALAGRLDLPVVATHPIQFVKREDYRAHEARVCIAQGYVLGDQRRPREFRPSQYFKTQDEMAELFEDLPEALANTVEVARRCSFEFELGKSRLPDFPTPRGESIEEYLRLRSGEGLEARLAALYPDEAARANERARYAERLEFELKVIIQMGFAGYFLIVADFINWAQSNGVPVGPGRGSGAGSLVAYALGITGLDPLRYELLFERFLNPERVSMPDFDIDFCQDGRDRVIDYVKQKYGAECVSQIATFGTMAAKAVVRDVGRVLGMPYGEVDRIAKLVPFELGITLTKALEMEPQLRALMKEQEGVAELMELALALEGLTRNVGMHAGGVLIAPGKLTDFAPLYSAEGSNALVSQFDKDDVEKAGLVKFDFLGLTTLTIIAEATRNIHALGQPDFDVEKIPLDDPAAYKVFSSGNTVAIFQFESRGMRDLIMRARPDRLEDLIALNALYRPGPMDLIPEFIDRKHGKTRWDYLDPRLKEILDPTYGVMTYQEHVMTIAQVIGGYTLGGADLLRRAMGKKKPEEMAKQRAIFTAGAEERGLVPARANILFDQMEKFAGYGFNKSHSAAYALIAYQTAFMKTHHAAAFMAANMTAVMDDTDKVQSVHEDALKNGLKIAPPDINAGEYRFVPVDEKNVQFGLGAVKGTGRGAIENIVAARAAGGPFKDLGDFCRRVDRRIVNRRAMEALIKAGAFDALEPNRASLAASLGNAIDAADKGEQFANQSNLFGGADDAAAEVFALVKVPMWPERDRLINEKQALGFYLSGHPFNAYRDELRRVASTPLNRVVPTNFGETVMLAGVIYGVQMRNTRRGRMAILTLDDATAKLEVVVFGELFHEKRAIIAEDQVIALAGKVQNDEFSGGLRVTAEKLMDLSEVRAAHARVLRLKINGQADAAKLRQILAPYQGGGVAVSIRYRNTEGECDIRLPDAYKVKISEPLLASLNEWLREENVEVVY
ncbi:DNA polymerase III subunit alpha [Usitatibacter palustris]|uniref:DNA polymerase III subunit alpha n=1 Tax=Usitatibacter palustris TaxID=2732487 RepID=A0A6M4H4G5_9PROT|nr:DNA polymerase III subunit alpha [Usitatibacter palustris]QJR14509.1 DNA polymerase III subunit alpha [Usitatibacter palustris]